MRKLRLEASPGAAFLAAALFFFLRGRELLALLPEKMTVHRLTGDGDKKTLVSPRWSADKKDVMNSIRRYGEENMAVPGYVRAVLDTLERNGFAAYLVGGVLTRARIGR